ncbi:MAG: SEL1-like repeat protein, partial [Desulfobacterota bacterium]|nr:SEL1-like repeat protein [Thermodesulfobacteriota bacterium]
NKRHTKNTKVNAHNNIALKNYERQGVLRDTTLAFTWLSLAADQGFADAAKNRDFVAARMTAEQKAVAGKRLDEWRARKKGKRWWKPAFFTGITSLRP